MTIKDVAKRAGVCLVTASRAMNGRESVRPTIRRRVLGAAKELDYTPNLLARGLAGSSTSLISILVSKLSNPYFGLLTEQISLRLNTHGISSVLCDSPDKNENLVRSLCTNGTFMISTVDPVLIREMAERRPTVGINSLVPKGVEMSSIELDFINAYSELVNAALGARKKKFAFLSNVSIEFQKKKLDIARRMLKSLKMKPVNPVAGESFGSVEEILSYILPNPGSIDAVFCENDIFASRLALALSSRKESAKDEMPLIIGCDGIFQYEGFWTISVDVDLIAQNAVESYMDVSTGKSKHRKVTIVPKAIIRS